MWPDVFGVFAHARLGVFGMDLPDREYSLDLGLTRLKSGVKSSYCRLEIHPASLLGRVDQKVIMTVVWTSDPTVRNVATFRQEKVAVTSDPIWLECDFVLLQFISKVHTEEYFHLPLPGGLNASALFSLLS